MLILLTVLIPTTLRKQMAKEFGRVLKNSYFRNKLETESIQLLGKQCSRKTRVWAAESIRLCSNPTLPD